MCMPAHGRSGPLLMISPVRPCAYCMHADPRRPTALLTHAHCRLAMSSPVRSLTCAPAALLVACDRGYAVVPDGNAEARHVVCCGEEPHACGTVRPCVNAAMHDAAAFVYGNAAVMV